MSEHVVTDSAGVTCRYTRMDELRPGDVVILGWRTTVERIEEKDGKYRVIWEGWPHPDQWNEASDRVPVEAGS